MLNARHAVWVYAVSNTNFSPKTKTGPYICLLGAFPTQDAASAHAQKFAKDTGMSAFLATHGTFFAVMASPDRLQSSAQKGNFLYQRAERVYKAEEEFMYKRIKAQETGDEGNCPEILVDKIMQDQQTHDILEEIKQQKIRPAAPDYDTNVPRQFEQRNQRYTAIAILDDDVRSPTWAAPNGAREPGVLLTEAFDSVEQAEALVKTRLLAEIRHANIYVVPLYEWLSLVYYPRDKKNMHIREEKARQFFHGEKALDAQFTEWAAKHKNDPSLNLLKQTHDLPRNQAAKRILPPVQPADEDAVQQTHAGDEPGISPVVEELTN